jgi:GxxExxY protein
MQREEVTAKDSNGAEGQLLYKEECYAIQGAVFEVYKQMGCGFLEAVYHECLEREMAERGIAFVSQQPLDVTYKSMPLTQKYKADMVCFGKILIEIKAMKDIAPEHKAQVLNYLKASGLRLGMIVNFGHHPQVQIVRIAL